ncbi:MAG: DUF6563 family protein [Paludibacter sp.]|nr:DUF6563 family protein [Paludibacter sp.]
MKQIFLLLALALITNYTLSQKYQNGGYKSYEELKNNTPAYPADFAVTRRTTADIKAWGGNDYKVECTDESVSKKMIKSEIWGIIKNDTLYLNAFPIVNLGWYAKVEIPGKYCFLRPSFPVNPKIQKQLGLNEPQYGYMFGAIGGAIEGAQLAVKRIPLIYNVETGEKILLNESGILKILESKPDLNAEFEKEADKSNKAVLLRYLIKVNDQEK